MRLLKRDDDGNISPTRWFDKDSDVPKYAILSHRWGTDEVVLKDIQDGTAKGKAGYHKIQFCADQALRDGLRHFWVDTCCIDRSSSAELQESINCMFRWYGQAAKCYAFLADVPSKSFCGSEWFTRGWTLQELIAPKEVDFFSLKGDRLGNKSSLEHDIHLATRIPVAALRGSRLSDFDISERMAWIDRRETTRPEDKAYALFGIIGTCIPILYGEGRENAFERLHDMIASKGRKERQQDEQTKICLADLMLTDPRDDLRRIADTKGGLFHGASNWILGHNDFCQWRDKDARLLWIKGDPGKGKTMLLIAIVEHLQQATASALSYFFCQGTNGSLNNAAAVLRGLIYLLCIQQPFLASHLRARYDHAGTKLFDDANKFYALSKVLENMMRDDRLQIAYLVVDALDECVADKDQLLRFIAEHAVISPRIKWIVSSRNIPEIEKLLRGNTFESSGSHKVKLSLEIAENAGQVRQAVEAFIDHKLSDLDSLQYNHETQGRVRDIMLKKANGTFLWVALVVKELVYTSSWELEAVMEEMPEGLEELYDQIRKQVQKLGRGRPELCRLVLSAVTLAYRPLHLAELAVVSGLPAHIFRGPSNERKVEEVVTLCGSFLSVKDRLVYLIHQSVKDYLSGRAAGAIFPSGPNQAHHAMFVQSADTMSTGLRRNIYRLPSPGVSVKEVRTPEPDPLASLRYPCVHWASHFFDAISESNDPDWTKVSHFIRKSFLHWLEAVALLRNITDSIISLRRLETALNTTQSEQIVDLVKDAVRFALHNRHAIENAPL